MQDFPQYGVENVEDDNKELNDKMEEIFKQIGSVITEKSYKLLEKMHDLNELCRLFLEAVGIDTPESEFMDYPL